MAGMARTPRVLDASTLNAACCETGNNVPSNLTKGSGSNLSAVIYGNFADLLIGLYGTLEILVDPYTDFAKGTTGVRALQTIDIAVRHAESFAAMKDAIA